jgi:hypothetical protein
MSVLQKLTEGIVKRDLSKEGEALLTKWEKTGLLEGLGSDKKRQNMASLLENQAKELLREASSMARGDVEGFASVAFPIVRRVFGGLIANDLVSVQPMSLPSGLIFFLDFQHTGAKLGAEADDSLYGGGIVGQQVTGGVSLSGNDAAMTLEEGFYSLNNAYSSPTGSTIAPDANTSTLVMSGTVGGSAAAAINATAGGGSTSAAAQAWLDRLCRYDPDLSGSVVAIAKVALADITGSSGEVLNKNNLVAITIAAPAGLAQGTGAQVRRLSQLSGTTHVYLVAAASGSENSTRVADHLDVGLTLHFPLADNFDGTPSAGSSNALGSVVGQNTWGLENTGDIPEIDIKVDSISVTAITKKLKAKWTPELGQDLNAYHNLDAEVELTSILSEQIALEIDREILEDLVVGATAATRFWSRAAGRFVNRQTGEEVGATTATPDFTGTVSEWYETLVETINDVSAQIHRKTLRGGANFIVVSPEVANILEFTAGFRAKVSHDDNKGTVGAVNTGNLSKKWDVWVDPYFLRNVVLVGRRGSSFLESGYVYAPYVPLQVTPTIFGIEDFVPRKGVMTRYAKKMVRPDMYGLVIVRDLV